jgi:predicted  nucleic acid-binding Zn-ribbon protein
MTNDHADNGGAQRQQISDHDRRINAIEARQDRREAQIASVLDWGRRIDQLEHRADRQDGRIEAMMTLPVEVRNLASDVRELTQRIETGMNSVTASTRASWATALTVMGIVGATLFAVANFVLQIARAR